jgi:hypothetical protein
VAAFSIRTFVIPKRLSVFAAQHDRLGNFHEAPAISFQVFLNRETIYVLHREFPFSRAAWRDACAASIPRAAREGFVKAPAINPKGSKILLRGAVAHWIEGSTVVKSE